MAPRTSRRQLSDYEKGMINAFFYCFGCITAVAKLVGRPWTTVKSCLARATERCSIDNMPRSGRPALLNRQARRRIAKAAKANRTMPRKAFRDRFAPGVSLSTVDRVLREANIKKWLAKDRPKLKPEHVAKRLRWALERKDWTAEDFEGVVWSDECSVERGSDPRQIWVFQEPAEKWLEECIRPKPKAREISVMVGGCFWGRNRGPLVCLDRSITKTVYLRLLRRYLIPVLCMVQDTLGNPCFQPDNAPVHKAEVVMNWFERMNITVEDHPPYSPDLNPIEHIWVELKRRLHQQYPGIADTRGGPKAVKKRLREVLPLVWETIPPEFFEKLWRSMPHRVAAVIEAKGWYTRY